MGKSKYILQIDKPCNESWSSMTPAEKGRFCNQCSKTVTDFSDLSDNEIVKLVDKSNGTFCGRLNKDQLERLIVSNSNQPQNTGLKRMIAALLLLATTGSIKAQTNKSVEISCVDIPVAKHCLTDAKQSDKELKSLNGYTIEGKVVDAGTRLPLSFGSVVIDGTDIRATTNKEGMFKLIIPQEINADKILIQVAYIGYHQTTFVINRKNVLLIKDLPLSPLTSVLMGEVVVTMPPKKKW